MKSFIKSIPLSSLRITRILTLKLSCIKGPLVRIGPNQLLSTDPDVLRRMSAVRSGYTKGKFYASGKIVPGVDNVVSLRDPAKHKEMRALMAPGVSQNLRILHVHSRLTLPSSQARQTKVTASKPP
jgi:hypothetical protein